MRWPLGILIIVFLVLAVGVPLVYAGRVYPGVVVHGVSVGGKSQAQALAAVSTHDKTYASEPIAITSGKTIVRLTPTDLGLTLNSKAAVEQAMEYGREGGFGRWRSIARALIGRPTTVGMIGINADKLAAYTVGIADDATVAVANAQFIITGDQVSVQPATNGQRLDMYAWVNALRWHLATGAADGITAPTASTPAVITGSELELLKPKVARYVSAPITLTSPDGSKTVDLTRDDIVAWLGASRTGITDISQTPSLDSVLHTGAVPIQVGLDSNKVDEYVATLAGDVDQAPVNAVLGFDDAGKTTIVTPAQNGLKLDVAKTTAAVKEALDKPADQRNVTMVAATATADVSAENLSKLGLQDHLSTGQTYFPGSPSTRLINVRTGARKFNGILLKPGEVFSFGKNLGEVSAATGYVPELVILNNHEEKQYGGGLCQVSSTAYRAALLAGLPIVERHNHSFAVKYYTAPYGVPGVDATIYYPAVDFKFRNDTSGYLYMQTRMVGTTLTFDYFGTKTKYGTIRGPQFISGTTDATKPSHTVFWRDTYDLNGNLVKTDEIHTYYKSSSDFPITKQYN